jgi:hypothetical protein
MRTFHQYSVADIPNPGTEFFIPDPGSKRLPYDDDADPGCSSRIPDPDLVFLPIPDPGIKKAPDPGSG